MAWKTPLWWIWFKTACKRHYRSFFKSVGWLVFTAFCGTLPVWLLMIIDALSPDQLHLHKIQQLLRDMLIPFLGSAMNAEICIEALLCKVHFNKYAYSFFFASSALVLFLACITFTVVSMSKDDANFNDSIIWILNTFVVTYTVCFCLGVKTVMFIEEEKLHSK